MPELCTPWRAGAFERATCLVVDRLLAEELGLDPDWLTTREGVAFLSGQVQIPGSTPVAMAYAGHQFGNYSPRLGDGRALLLGEIVDRAGRLCDLHLKGSGPTPFARGGDGKAAVGPMLRESVMGRAMHALGIPTTRALAVLGTGERIPRDGGALPGAILVRVGASHLRVGTFEFAAARGDVGLLRRLADHAIARHCPEAHESENPALALYESVCMRQAELVARWMLVGFVHGVMNTDNTTISGETIDYGPCAFMDRHASATVFSSIDHAGRYAYGNQPGILQWNLARLAEAMLPLFDDDTDRAVGLATAALERFAERFSTSCREGMAAKLGIGFGGRGDGVERPTAIEGLVDGVPALLESQHVDHTLFFRRLSLALRGEAEPVRSLFADPAAFDAWAARWRVLLPACEVERARIAEAMDRVNPIYVPRNHRVELVLDAATAGDMAPLAALTDALAGPFDERPGLEPFAQPAPADAPPHRTYCGT